MMSATVILFWALAVLAFAGALTVLLTRDVIRLGLGLGAFLLSISGFFAWFGLGFLALAELFVYVGGVLVLALFALMLVHRPQPGSPLLDSRHDVTAAIACVGVFGFGVSMLSSSAQGPRPGQGAGVDALGDVLLGPMLPQFELVGLLLLVGLVAVVLISDKGRP